MTLTANKILHFSDKTIEFTAPYEEMILKFSFVCEERQTFLYCEEDFITTLSSNYTAPGPKEKYLPIAKEGLQLYLGEGNINPIVHMLNTAIELFYFDTFNMQDIALKVGPQEAKWAKRTIENKMRQHLIEYEDNFRWCRIGYPDEELRYKKIAKKGCCGFMDWEELDRTGQLWRFGFNYGH